MDYGDGTMEQGEMGYEGEEQGYDGYAGTGALEGSHNGEDFSSLPACILNACPKPRLTDEEKLARDCMRRRQTDLERRARIFDAKRRMIGVDKDALDAQVAEKVERAKQVKVENKGVDRSMAAIDKELKLIEVEKSRRRRNHEEGCKEYSMQQLNFQSRREYDLNDPLAKRKGQPARVGDDDPRCGASSMQKFSGEDLMKEERTRQQRAAMVSFIEQQKFEKSMLSKKGVDGGAFAMQVQEITALRNEIEENEMTLRKELQRKQYEDNINQATDNENRRKGLVQDSMDANQRELEFHKGDNFLNEKAPSHFNNRVIRDAYKGSNRQERVAVAGEQSRQREEKGFEKELDDHDSRQFANTVESTRKQLVAMERDKQRRRREMREQMAADNLQLQAEQRANKKHYNKVYTNEFSPDFFEQFGNGCR